MCPCDPAIGFSEDAVDSAYDGMRNDGGHAIRHLRDEGLIPNRGSLSSQVEQFKTITRDTLTSPEKSLDWRIGDTSARAFAGHAGSKPIVVFVAKEAPYAGRVLSAVVPDAGQIVRWGL